MIELLTVVNKIAIRDYPNQRIGVTIAKRYINLHIKYNGLNDHWTLDVYESGKLLLCGKKLVLDLDLFYGYNLGLGSLSLLHITSKEVIAEPNRTNLVNGDIRMYAFWKEYVELD